MFGEAYMLCAHAQETDITCWHTRYPRAIFCLECSDKLDLAMVTRDAYCDACLEPSPVLGIWMISGAAMVGKALLCHVCSPYLRELTEAAR
jgi:hypothetical protein